MLSRYRFHNENAEGRWNPFWGFIFQTFFSTLNSNSMLAFAKKEFSCFPVNKCTFTAANNDHHLTRREELLKNIFTLWIKNKVATITNRISIKESWLYDQRSFIINIKRTMWMTHAYVLDERRGNRTRSFSINIRRAVVDDAVMSAKEWGVGRVAWGGNHVPF